MREKKQQFYERFSDKICCHLFSLTGHRFQLYSKWRRGWCFVGESTCTYGLIFDGNWAVTHVQHQQQQQQENRFLMHNKPRILCMLWRQRCNFTQYTCPHTPKIEFTKTKKEWRLGRKSERKKKNKIKNKTWAIKKCRKNSNIDRITHSPI